MIVKKFLTFPLFLHCHWNHFCIVNREDRRHLFKRGLQSEIRAGSSDAAVVYRRLFSGDGDEEQGKQAQQVRGVEPVMCYLPPYYDEAGDHVGGGMPDVAYPNFKTNPGAYGRK